jgi:hypothetical protein
MKVKLNAFRGEDRPGDVIDVTDTEAAELIAHGAAFPADAGKTKTSKTREPAARRRTVRGEAALQASSETQGDELPSEP